LNFFTNEISLTYFEICFFANLRYDFFFKIGKETEKTKRFFLQEMRWEAFPVILTSFKEEKLLNLILGSAQNFKDMTSSFKNCASEI